MSKLIFKDGTALTIMDGMTGDAFKVECTPADMAEIFDKLTDTVNLERVELQDNDGGVMAVLANKAVTSCRYDAATGTATFELRTIDNTAQRLDALEQTVDILVMGEIEV